MSKLGLTATGDIKSGNFLRSRKKIMGYFDSMFEVLQGIVKPFEVRRWADHGGKCSGLGCIKVGVNGDGDIKSHRDQDKARKIREYYGYVKKIARWFNT